MFVMWLIACATVRETDFSLFLIWKLNKIQIVVANFNFVPNKLNFCCGNYSRAETLRGNTVCISFWKSWNDGEFTKLVPENKSRGSRILKSPNARIPCRIDLHLFLRQRLLLETRNIVLRWIVSSILSTLFSVYCKW